MSSQPQPAASGARPEAPPPEPPGPLVPGLLGTLTGAALSGYLGWLAIKDLAGLYYINVPILGGAVGLFAGVCCLDTALRRALLAGAVVGTAVALPLLAWQVREVGLDVQALRQRNPFFPLEASVGVASGMLGGLAAGLVLAGTARRPLADAPFGQQRVEGPAPGRGRFLSRPGAFLLYLLLSLGSVVAYYSLILMPPRLLR